MYRCFYCSDATTQKIIWSKMGERFVCNNCIKKELENGIQNNDIPLRVEDVKPKRIDTVEITCKHCVRVAVKKITWEKFETYYCEDCAKGFIKKEVEIGNIPSRIEDVKPKKDERCLCGIQATIKIWWDTKIDTYACPECVSATIKAGHGLGSIIKDISIRTKNKISLCECGELDPSMDTLLLNALKRLDVTFRVINDTLRETNIKLGKIRNA